MQAVYALWTLQSWTDACMSLLFPVLCFLCRLLFNPSEHFPIGLDDALPSIVRYDLYSLAYPCSFKPIDPSDFAHDWQVGDNALTGALGR